MISCSDKSVSNPAPILRDYPDMTKRIGTRSQLVEEPPMAIRRITERL